MGSQVLGISQHKNRGGGLPQESPSLTHQTYLVVGEGRHHRDPSFLLLVQRSGALDQWGGGCMDGGELSRVAFLYFMQLAERGACRHPAADMRCDNRGTLTVGLCLSREVKGEHTHLVVI